MAHSSSIHARRGDWLVPDLRAAIQCIPNPLAASDDADIPVAAGAAE
jgi:hypothetical protein